MKVGLSPQSAAIIGSPIEHEDQSSAFDGISVSFSSQLRQINERNYQKKLDELHERIYVQGQVVAQKASLKEFQNYRTLVSRFIYEAVSNGYSFHKNSRFDARGQHSACAYIKRINDKMDELAQELLNEQADNLKLLGMAEEIRGMLVDLYL